MFKFPPEDLMEQLIEVYFTRINVFQPLLHRVSLLVAGKTSMMLNNHALQPTFQRYIDEGTHFRDRDFAHVLLLGG